MRLDSIPRLGLITEPAPLTALPALAARLGLASFVLKRDDLLPALGGGTKARKLDVSLAVDPLVNAPRWISAGAIGSGHLVALVAAGRRQQRPIEAHIFWEPVSEGVAASLGFVASFADGLHFHRGRIGLGLRHPRVVLGSGSGVLPPGGSAPPGVVGVALGALELAAQIEAGSTPAPDHVFLPLGSGGATAGLRIGFALAGLRPTIHAIAAVEPAFAGRRWLERLCTQTVRWLAHHGVMVGSLPPVRIRRDWVGAGYAIPTNAGGQAIEALHAQTADLPDPVQLESVYSAKAMAALLDDAPGGHVLFWVTPRRLEPLPQVEGWQDRLPGWLRRRLHHRPHYQGLTRRRALVLGGLGSVGAGLALRLTGYPDWPDWNGAHLAEWEAHVLRAAAEVIAPGVTPAVLDATPAAIDRYLVSLPPGAVREVHALLLAVEHGTGLTRLSRQPPPARHATLERLAGLNIEVWRGLRDLCLMGVYQQPATWHALDYGGPRVTADPRPDPYAALTSAAPPPGWTPA